MATVPPPTLESLSKQVTLLTAKLNEGQVAADSAWIMTAGVLVFMMNAGFALLESGTVRFKNYQNILLKNIMHALVGGLIWWAWGFAFAYGDVDGGFIGKKFFVGIGMEKKGEDYQYANWWFQYAFAATSATIVSGSVAERINIYCYILFAFLMIGFIYPVIVAWTWGSGWLFVRGFDDFAGSGIVHMTGGIAGLTGAIICGPRLGRFTDMRTGKSLKDQEEEKPTQSSSPPSGKLSGASYSEVCRKFKDGEIEIEHVHAFIRSYTLTLDEKSFAGSSPNSVALGTLILWVGWMFFNGGSSLKINEGNWKAGAKAMVNTILAPSAAGLFTFLTRKHITGQNKDHRLDFGALTNGLLAGCVSITASCASVEPWAAILIGLIGSIVYSLACILMEKFEIDDPLEAFQVHGCCGIWGVIAMSLFHTEKGLFYGAKSTDKVTAGVQFLGVQCLGILCISAWSGGLSAIYFFAFKKMGKIRLNEEDEILGGDIHYFAPIQLKGSISQYAKGLQLTRLNSEMVAVKKSGVEQAWDQKIQADNSSSFEV